MNLKILPSDTKVRIILDTSKGLDDIEDIINIINEELKNKYYLAVPYDRYCYKECNNEQVIAFTIEGKVDNKEGVIEFCKNLNNKVKNNNLMLKIKCFELK